MAYCRTPLLHYSITPLVKSLPRRLFRFRFPALPVEPHRKLVRVRARGRQLDVEIARPEAGGSVVIRFDQLLEA